MGSGDSVFPADFEFGVCSSAYQVEGAASVDGKGPSIWDVFSHQLKTITDRTTGDIGPDHYHHLDEDLALLKRLGVTSYRCSISWSRLQPDGRGELNPAGIDFYDRLFDGLLEAGISPMVSLYDWDLPHALQVPGQGWLNRDTAGYFVDYVNLAIGRFVDRVDKWIPIYSPSTHAMIGHAIGEHAPGRVLGMACFQAGHHLNLAQGRAISALRSLGAKQVGTDQNHQLTYPASEGEADRLMAKYVNDLWSEFYAQPLLAGTYPDSVLNLLGDSVKEGDIADIHQPIDFFGLGYYGPMMVGAAPAGSEVPFERRVFPDVPKTSIGWAVMASGLYDMLIHFKKTYPELPPIYLTENGYPGEVPIGRDGAIDDQARVDYLSEHLAALSDAIADGVDVRGYFADSFMDGFFWEFGLGSRFGLVHVDFDTLERTPKKSFHWYADFISSHSSRRQ
jgi:beta-glucosidase